jgi:hypothetical protein
VPPLALLPPDDIEPPDPDAPPVVAPLPEEPPLVEPWPAGALVQALTSTPMPKARSVFFR